MPAIAALLAVGMTACTGGGETKPPAAEEKKEPIKIGAVLSLSGTYAGLGTPEKNTIDMEVARINEAGGIDGRDVEVVIVDDATDPAKAQAAVSKLVDQDKVVAIIGATGTGQTMAMRGDIERTQVPQVSVAGGTVITEQFSPWVFQTPWSNRIVAPFTLKELQAKGIKKIALIGDSGGFGKDGIAVFKSEASKFGCTVVAEESFNPGDTDMTTQLTKIKGAGPEAVVLVSAGKEAAIVAQNMKQLGLGVPLYGTHGNARVEFIKGAADAAEGVRFAAGKILIPEAYGKDSENYEVATEFIERYQAKYGAAPDTFAGHAYDALYLITEAAGRVDGEITPDALRDEIEKTSGFVGIGGEFTYTDKDHNGLAEDDIVMYEIKGGKWVLAE